MWSLLVWCGSPCPTTTTLGKTTPDQVMLSQDVAANVCTKSSSFSVESTAPSVLKTRGAQQDPARIAWLLQAANSRQCPPTVSSVMTALLTASLPSGWVSRRLHTLKVSARELDPADVRSCGSAKVTFVLLACDAGLVLIEI